jgi:tetratricopeptide (TPR) repeat protein
MGLDPDLSTNFILRPVTYFTFFLNYTFGGMRPAGFRAVNIVIHCANAVLLFLVLWTAVRGSRKRASLPVASGGFIALATALLFVSHPLQTESVTYIVQRFTSMGVFFYLLVIWTHILSRLAHDARRARRLRAVSLAALILGMLSKEFVFCAPFMIVAVDWLVLGTPFKRAIRAARLHLLCLPLVPALIVLTAMAQHGGHLSLAGAVNVANSVDIAQNPYTYALTQSRVILSYLRLIVVPVGLNLDRDYPLSRSLGEWQVLASLATILAINAGAWLWYRRQPQDLRRSLIWCSVFGAFFTLLPDSSIVPLPDLMADHRSYLPSLGALTALVCLMDAGRVRMTRAGMNGHTVMACMVVWILALSAATCVRNHAWRSERSLWRDTALKSPAKFRPWANLGVAYYEDHQKEKAIFCLVKALQLEPRFVTGYVNLVAVQTAEGAYREAIATAEKGLAYAPGHGILLYHKGWAHYLSGETNRSLECLTLATNTSGTDIRSHVALGLIHSQLGQHEDALKAFQGAARLKPDDASLRDAVLKTEDRIRKSRGVRPASP